MIIELAPPPTRFINEYDFSFSSGFFMPVPIDLAAGDTIQFDPDTILVHLSSKPSIGDPGKKLPAEDITIFQSHIVAIQHRIREVTQLSKDQTQEWIKTLKEYDTKVVN